jgi:hypothetical protein
MGEALNPAPKTFKYSLHWAENVISQLRVKYARGTDMVEEVLGISDRDLARYLAFGDPLWRHLRETIKNTQGNVDFYKERYTTEHLLSTFLGRLSGKRFGDQAERLAKRVRARYNQEAGFKAGAPPQSASGGAELPASSGPDFDALGPHWTQGVLCL